MNFLQNPITSFISRSQLLVRISKKFIPKNWIVRIDEPWFLPSKQLINNQTLLVVCPDGFDQSLPSASTLIRSGFAKGWAKSCGPAKLISIYDLMKEINFYPKPAVFMTIYDFSNITLEQSKKLRSVDLFVWISIHPKKIKSFINQVKLDMPDHTRWLSAYPKIIASEPKFIWNSATKSTMYWYDDWIKEGFKWITMHPAANENIYYPDKRNKKFNNIKIAYVGGYWKEKAQAFDLYLKPWESIFTPFGYAKWPYKNYGGRLSQAEERQLYSSARLIPLVTSPGGWLLGEITERYFKTPACKAFCIADQNPTINDIFNKDEMLRAESPEHFHGLVKQVLDDKINREKWINNGFSAIMKKHLYRHRALQIKDALKATK